MRQPQFRSTFARAVVPVLAGIGFFAVLGLALWGVAAIIASNSDQATNNLSSTYQDVGYVETFAAIIERDGPIVFRDLLGSDRNIVLDHEGDDAFQGWAMYLAWPADSDSSCHLEQVKGTHQFVDCQGRTLTVDELAAVPRGVRPIVSSDGLLTLDLTADAN